MTRRAELKNAMTRGVLDPDLYDRWDLNHYYLALKRGKNLICTPQGGLSRRQGTIATRNRYRRLIAPVAVQEVMITAANGGTPANLIDQDPATLFTTVAVSQPLFVLAEVDFGALQSVAMVDVLNFSAGTAAVNDALVVEYWTGTAWTAIEGSGDAALKPLRDIRTAARNRRFSRAPGAAIASQYFRVVAYNATAAGAVSIGGLRFWSERPKISPRKTIAFAKTDTERFELILTDRNIDVFRDGVFMSSIAVPVPAELVSEVKTEQSLDTMFLFHQDVEPQVVVRQGAPDEWNAADAVFTNVKNLTSSTAFSGNQDEVQELVFAGLTPGESVSITLGNSIAAPAVFSTAAALASQIAAAIESLPGVNADDVAVTQIDGSTAYRVAFVNSNGARRWPRVSAMIPGSAVATVSSSVVIRGLKADGKIMAADTGWPRCGRLVQSRLMLGGFRAAPSTFGFSRTGSLLDFLDTSNPLTADLAIFNTLQSDEVETIIDIFVGQNIQIFTEGEWWIETRTIDATQAVNAISTQTRYGIAPGVSPISVQGSSVFVQSAGEDGAATVVRDMVYSYEAQNYSAEPLTLLSPQLLTDISSIAHRAGKSTREASLLFFINKDGSAAILTLLKSQEIIAMTPAETQGAFRDVMSDTARNIWFGIERTINGVTDVWLEKLGGELGLDAAVTGRFSVPSVVISGLGHLEARQVYAYLDRDLYGPFTVAGGQIIVDTPCLDYTVGLKFDVQGCTLPIREKLSNGQPFKPPCRVYEVEFSLGGSGPFEMRANGGEWREVSLRHLNGGPPPAQLTGEEPANDWLDVPLLDRLYKGYFTIENLQGWTEHGEIEWRQLSPAPFKLRSVRYQVSY